MAAGVVALTLAGCIWIDQRGAKDSTVEVHAPTDASQGPMIDTGRKQDGR